MNKLTTDRFDAQHCTVHLNSNAITVKNASHAVELRYLDESDLLEAVCDFIKSRCFSGDREKIHAEILNATVWLGDKIRSDKEKTNA